ncbi:30S ribosomal protein S8e [Candidatus Woesearchaeota archaeon]|nr:30S ribosomal protein S8e [Candidatus Woesearchaeota archaeon]
MAITQTRSKKKVSGGRYITCRTKKIYELGRLPTFTKLSELKKKNLRTKAGHQKTILFSSNIANVYSKKDKKYHKAKILTVVDNAANRNFIRRNIMTKGAVIETDKGKARITSRPGQEGTINAILLD